MVTASLYTNPKIYAEEVKDLDGIAKLLDSISNSVQELGWTGTLFALFLILAIASSVWMVNKYAKTAKEITEARRYSDKIAIEKIAESMDRIRESTERTEANIAELTKIYSEMLVLFSKVNLDEIKMRNNEMHDKITQLHTQVEVFLDYIPDILGLTRKGGEGK